jgi:hypothetical protein
VEIPTKTTVTAVIEYANGHRFRRLACIHHSGDNEGRSIVPERDDQSDDSGSNESAAQIKILAANYK